MYFNKCYMRRVATKEQCRDTVNIVKQFKDLCDNFREFFLCGGWTGTIVSFYMSVINSSYIYLIILLFA